MNKYKPTFVDVFSGCGGFSLGMFQAGMDGRFAIEKNKDAFASLKHNMLSKDKPYRFSWPNWLPKSELSIEDLLKDYKKELKNISGRIDVMIGGPPCQGFSSAGKRLSSDPRNKLFYSYLELVKLLKPKIILVENVRGFTVNFGKNSKIKNYSNELKSILSESYNVYEDIIDLSSLGVPQRRQRYFLIGLSPELEFDNPFEYLKNYAPKFLKKMNITIPPSSISAISDLEISRCGVVQSSDYNNYFDIRYRGPKTKFQKFLNAGVCELTDLRIPNHGREIKKRYSSIIKSVHRKGRLNTDIGPEIKQKHNIKKASLRVLDPLKPAPTITTMPDDLLHYHEPRTLTVRENARLQCFPDWFEFQGKYATGGRKRKFDVPRYTQVANAVPPLVANILGNVILKILLKNKGKHRRLVFRGQRFMKLPKMVA